ncbi:hypothetical protein Vafri_15562 [Volvox africanus]|uniref:Uncharacterized protein n=1 Tax=Volvox africanus TaxID=51714 RepID=A0A8J4F4U2_9CHLO|nr:hypothetical protein Vafri_15562 [Volvox africanus]
MNIIQLMYCFIGRSQVKVHLWKGPLKSGNGCDLRRLAATSEMRSFGAAKLDAHISSIFAVPSGITCAITMSAPIMLETGDAATPKPTHPARGWHGHLEAEVMAISIHYFFK